MGTGQVTKIQRLALVAQVFTPSAPVSDLSFLSGRLGQISDLVSAVSQRGQHVALYGERGVGKTSLANILDEFFVGRGVGALHSVRVNCGVSDDFYTIWLKVFRELGI